MDTTQIGISPTPVGEDETLRSLGFTHYFMCGSIATYYLHEIDGWVAGETGELDENEYSHDHVLEWEVLPACTVSIGVTPYGVWYAYDDMHDRPIDDSYSTREEAERNARREHLRNIGAMSLADLG